MNEQEARQEANRMFEYLTANPLIVHVDPTDIHHVFKGMYFQIVGWDNRDKESPSITLGVIRPEHMNFKTVDD